MAPLIKLLVVAGVITLTVVYARHAITNWKITRARKARTIAVLNGDDFCTGIELPHGSEESKRNFSKLLVRLAPRVPNLDVLCLAGYPEKHKPGDLPVLSFLLRCPGDQASVLKQEVKNIYRDATLIPYGKDRPLPEPMLNAIEAHQSEHFEDPPEHPSAPLISGGSEGDGEEIQMTSGGGIAGRLQARKAARA